MFDICSTDGASKIDNSTLYVQGTALFKRSPLEVKNLDMFAYINSKFVYAERHTRRMVENMYTDM